MASVGTLLLAIFGYFYTVLPVFQNQKLQEDNAKLQLDNEDARIKNQALLETHHRLSIKIEQLQDSFDTKNRALNVAIHNVDRARTREADAKRLAAAAEAEKKIQYGELDKARWRIALSAYGSAVFSGRMRETINEINGEYGRIGAEYIRAAEGRWPVPREILLEALEPAQKSSSVPSDYFQKIHVRIDASSPELSCTKPDFLSISLQYDAEHKTLSQIARKTAAEEIEKQRLTAESKGERLLITQEDIDHFERMYNIDEEFKLNSKYRDIIDNERNKCYDLAKNFIKNLSRDVGVTLN